MYKHIGRKYFVEHSQALNDILLGYGSVNSQLNYDPWGEVCHVAVIGHSDPGGPAIIGAGRPITGDKWFPILNGGGDYLFRNRRTLFIDLVFNVADRTVVTKESLTVITPNSETFLGWLGFLLHLRDCPAGLTFG
jgi:hypothetical protein